MKKAGITFLSVTTIIVLLCSGASYAWQKGETMSREHRMIYSTPISKHDPATPAAEQWDQALPTGNGRIGALVFGNISNETVILTHDSLFFRTNKPVLPDVSEHLPKIRKLMKEGNYEQAGRYFKNQVQIDYNYHGSDSFHPAFNITVEMPAQVKAQEIYRIVDFETGEVIVTWKQGDVTYNRRLFVSRKDNLVVMSIKASRPQSVNCSVGLLPTALKSDELGDGNDVRVPRFPTGRVAKIRLDEVPITFNLKAKNNYLTIRADYDKGGKYNLAGGQYGGCARIVVDGPMTRTSNLRLSAEKANEVLILVRLFANENADSAMERELKALQSLNADYDELLSRHVALHRDLFMRVQLDLNARDKNRQLSNEKLVNEANHGQAYNALLERMFDFGRFALICSSSIDGMPANLQGIWNGVYGPPWAADYHADMNIEMNYWQALTGNLAEITLCYFDYYESLLEDFRKNARNITGCRGILAPMSGTTHGVGELNWSCWTAGAGWLAQLFYDYWLHTGNREFLKNRAVPFMKEVALFYEDFLVEGPDGRYEFIPSMSPENVPSNAKSNCTINATMDIAVAKEILNNLCSACELLNIEKESVSRWREMLAKLPPYLINEDGAIKEWSHPEFADNYEHRHMSHLYPLYPGLEISSYKDTKLFQACKVAMEKKWLEFEYPCAWSYVYAAAEFARLEQPEQALEALKIVARGHTLPNLFTTLWLYSHKPPMMQFEAASGIPASIMEMLMYSDGKMIKLLPALPKEWNKGHIKGLLARGGFEVEIYWENGTLRKAVIRSLLGNDVKVYYNDKDINLKLKAGDVYLLDPSP